MGDNMEVRITYETLFDILRTEKNRHELQKLPPTFFKDLADYLNEKKNIIEDSSKNISLFASEEKERAERQLANAKKIFIDIYEKREKKILETALDKVRVNAQVISMSSFLEEEERLFEQIVEFLEMQRKEVLLKILSGKELSESIKKHEIREEYEEIKKEAVEEKESKEELNVEQSEEEKEIEKALKEHPIEPETAKKDKLIRFICAVPKFIGKELEIYGPFEEEDIANMPAEIAEILIAKGRAEEIEEN